MNGKWAFTCIAFFFFFTSVTQSAFRLVLHLPADDAASRIWICCDFNYVPSLVVTLVSCYKNAFSCYFFSLFLKKISLPSSRTFPCCCYVWFFFVLFFTWLTFLFFLFLSCYPRCRWANRGWCNGRASVEDGSAQCVHCCLKKITAGHAVDT